MQNILEEFTKILRFAGLVKNFNFWDSMLGDI